MAAALACVAAGGCARMETSVTEKAAVQTRSASASAAPDWAIASPADAGLDAGRLDAIDEAVAHTYRKTTSVLIVKDGKLVYERYYRGGERERPANVYSVTKSVLSALTGIAIEQGWIRDTQQRLAELVPEPFDAVKDAQMKELTVWHALTMTGGLASVDDTIGTYFYSSDWNAYLLSQPTVAKPGTVFGYNTGLPHLLSAAITATSGMTTKEVADRYLFGPLGITDYAWGQDTQGLYAGGTNLSLTPRDMAKFGQLYLQNGVWEGKRVLPEAWIRESLQPHARAGEHTGYGYLFWLPEFKGPDGKTVFNYEANGYGGQHIRVVPDWNAVVVVTSDPNAQDGTAFGALVQEVILPAIAPSKSR